jgi:hypothetical protein
MVRVFSSLGYHVYVAWQRDCWGPAPGIYVATSRGPEPGEFTISRVVASCSASDPSISVLPDGRWALAYREGFGIVVLEEDAAVGSAPVGSVPVADVQGEPDPALGDAHAGFTGEPRAIGAPSPGGSAQDGPGLLRPPLQGAP